MQFVGECPIMASLLYIFVKRASKSRDILTNVVELLNKTMFQNRQWIFEQDSAPAHKKKSTQQGLEPHVPEFISNEHWSSASPDLNALDYKCQFWRA